MQVVEKPKLWKKRGPQNCPYFRLKKVSLDLDHYMKSQIRGIHFLMTCY